MQGLCGRTGVSRNAQSTRSRLTEEDLAQCCSSAGTKSDTRRPANEPDDVAVQQNRLPAAGRRILAVPQRHVVHDDVASCSACRAAARCRKIRGAPPSGGARASAASRRLRRLPIEIVDQIPAEDRRRPYASACGKPLLRKPEATRAFRSRTWRSRSREDVLDEDLAAKLLAEETDVAADDRAQIEQDRRARAVERA